jgi:hypothetical protein
MRYAVRRSDYQQYRSTPLSADFVHHLSDPANERTHHVQFGLRCGDTSCKITKEHGVAKDAHLNSVHIVVFTDFLYVTKRQVADFVDVKIHRGAQTVPWPVTVDADHPLGMVGVELITCKYVVLDWLRDIAGDGERFEKLRIEGVKRIGQEIEELSKEIRQLEDGSISLLSQIVARIDELTRTETPSVRQSIETSITRLEQQRTEEGQKRLYVQAEKKHLKGLRTMARNLYGDYQQAIRRTLGTANDDQQPDDARKALWGLLASLTLTEKGIKIALSGGVNRKALGSTLFVVAPAHGLSPPVADIVSAPSGPPSLAEPEIVSGLRSLMARAARSLRVRGVRRIEKGRLSIR